MTCSSRTRLATVSPFVLCSLVVLLASECAQSQIESTSVDRPDAARLIDQLDDSDPDVRRSATLRINGLGANALDAAEAAARRDDLSPEAQTRLQAALGFIRPRAALERKNAALTQWQNELFHKAYRAGGRTNRSYDADADAAIDRYLQIQMDPLHAPAEQRSAALGAFVKAEQSGCADRMILALHRLAEGDVSPIASPARHSVDAILYECAVGPYPAALRLHVWATRVAALRAVSPEDVKLLRRILVEALAMPGFDPREFDQRLEPMWASADLWLKSPEWHDLLDEYQNRAPRAPGPLLFRAEAAKNAASVYHQQRVKANAFNDAAVSTYLQMMKDAVAFDERAYERDPSDGRAPRAILHIHEYLARILRIENPTNETWFSRAIAIDPDDRDAYEMRMRYLVVSSGAEPMLEFGHDCLRRQNWRGGIPMLIVSAHEHAADSSGDRQAYFLQTQVWQDIRDAYDGLLVNYPDEIARRCELAKYACLCNQWADADQQFTRIADKPVLGVFGSEASYNYLRAKAHRLATGPREP